MSKLNPSTAPSSSAPHKKHWLFKIVIGLAVLGLLVVLLILIVLFVVWKNSLVNTVGKVHFDKPLPVPALAESSVSSDGTRTFDLSLQTGKTNFFDDHATDTWGVNGSYLGPTVRAKRGEKVQMRVKNTLSETSTIHWHGMHLPAQMDGGPHQPIRPDETWSPHWKITQEAATLWYHPHPHGQTKNHVYRGLAGMFIIDDDSPAAAQLPNRYGVDDLPIIVQDREFEADRQFDKPGNDAPDMGNEILVNGARTPHLDVTTEKVRLRLLNASTARIYNFGLSNGQPMQLIASDGGLLEAPVQMDRVVLSPGERAEVIVSLKAGEQAILRSYPLKVGSNFYTNRTSGGDDSLDIMQLRASEQLASSPELPGQLNNIERPPEGLAAVTRQFKLSGFTINGKLMDMARIDATIKKNETEVWEVSNIDTQPHNFHVHDVQFQVLSVNGVPPPPELAGRKDTVLMRPSHTLRLIMQFTDYADAQTPYMFHCHLLNHEDNGMMGQFVVVEPGQSAPGRLDTEGHQH